MHVIVIGKNHGNRSKWMKKLKPMITDPRGFYAESVADPSIGGIRIYMRDLATWQDPVAEDDRQTRSDSPSTENDEIQQTETSANAHEFIGTCLNRHTETCVRGYEHIVPALRAIPDGAHVIMDHIGHMDDCCPAFQEAVLDLFDRCTVLAAVSDHVPAYFQPILERNDVRIFNADGEETVFDAESLLDTRK